MSDQNETTENGNEVSQELRLAFDIDGKRYLLPSKFRIGELRTIKRMTGRNVEELEMTDPETMAALTLVVKQREDPGFTEAMLDEIEFQYVDADGNEKEKEDDAVPPAQAEATTTGVPS